MTVTLPFSSLQLRSLPFNKPWEGGDGGDEIQFNLSLNADSRGCAAESLETLDLFQRKKDEFATLFQTNIAKIGTLFQTIRKM